MKERLVGIDTGGTFTDFVVIGSTGLRLHKEPSTPDDPSVAVAAGLSFLLGDERVSVVHGSTVATNALLERRGARAALITTEGFEDVLEIGRQTRAKIYDLHVGREPPVIEAELRIGVPERVDAAGDVIEPIDEAAVDALAARLAELGAEAVAVCFLHSYANPEHERRVLRALEGRFDGFLTASHQVLPEFREYERCSTTAVNAYVGPVMSGYLGRLADDLPTGDVRIMQSNGGTISLETARRHAVQTVLSGPAGGVVGAFEIARRAGYDRIITFDMGGTSTDVCLCPGRMTRTSEAHVGDIPIRLPVIDIHTVGAGGGSIARRDEGGSLRVGPESAGADPGPVAYDRGGDQVTVTDANLVLGRLSSDHFLGGAAALAGGAAEHEVGRLGSSLGLSTTGAAQGILRVANATMERAIRVISLERGHDPRDFTLVCFGGAGAMHAADLAASLGIPRVLVPRAAGTLSALGMLAADYIRDYSRTLLCDVDRLPDDSLRSVVESLESRAREDFAAEGRGGRLVLERYLDVRYQGQGFELEVPLTDDFPARFHATHERRYGYADADRPVELVNVRVRAVGPAEPIDLIRGEPHGPDPAAAVIGRQPMVIGGELRSADLIDREALRPGNRISEPALIVEYSTTTVVPAGFRCTVDEWLNLILEPDAEETA